MSGCARKTDYAKLDRRFLDRWSPRAFKSDPIEPELLQTLFEAVDLLLELTLQTVGGPHAK